MKKFIKFYLIIICLLLCSSAEAVSRADFLAALLEARGLASVADLKNNSEFAASPAEFILKTGIITDYVDIKDVKAKVTRREALRWCIQALGLAFEADIVSDFNFTHNFTDINNLTRLEKGAVSVAVTMQPNLIANNTKFNGNQAISDKDMRALLAKVKEASAGLTLDVNIAPAEGITLLVHREGVFSGIPKWRVYADNFNDKEQAEAAQKFFKSKGYEMTALHPLYEYFLRSQVMDNYNEVRALINLIRKRGHSARVLPSLSNPKTDILPKYWSMLIIDPSYWNMMPVIIPNEGGRTLAPLSEIISANKNKNLRAAINAGFFAMTKKRTGYPIGILKIDGTQFTQPNLNRSCIAWNNNSYNTEDIEAMIGKYDKENPNWESMENIIQAGPLLIDEGEPVTNNEGFDSKILSVRHPRSAVGITNDGFWFFIALDGRNGLHSSGATISELTEILLSYNAEYALNLDGGGSTELIHNNKLYNFPSEGKERPISYGLGIMPLN
ncbi:MAG: phosphodiester glycosidase family protein [Synergistaceae bacterium]|nr:phosphodiester glycosidase family protein [Synergistaceae bacterium]